MMLWRHPGLHVPSTRSAGEPIGRLVFSSDGSLLAGATREAIVLWDISSASLAASLPLPVAAAAGTTPLHLAFAADGMFLVRCWCFSCVSSA